MCVCVCVLRLSTVWTSIVLLSKFFLESYPLGGRAMVLKRDGARDALSNDLKIMNVFEANWYTLAQDRAK